MVIPRKYILPVFFLTLFVGAMALGPMIYFGVGMITHIPFHRAMNRAFIVSAVASLGLFWSRIPLGILWPWNGDAWKQVLLGYVMAAVTVQAMIGFYLALAGFTSAHLTAQEVMTRVLLAVVAALLIPPLEETVFRGFVQSELTQSLGWCAGWIVAAAIFMLAHFVKIPAQIDQEPIHFWSGVTAIGSAFQPITEGFFLSGKGLNLFLIGLILGGIFLRSGSLWLNAGLHSGWILTLLLFPVLTSPVEPPRVAFFGGDLLSNPVTTVVLVLLGLWLWRFYRHPSVVPEPTHGTGENAL